MKIFLKKNKPLIKVTVFQGAFLLLITLGLSSNAPAQITAPVDDVTTRVQQTYDKTKDFKANFIQEITIKSIKKTDVEEGMVIFKTPKNMLWNYSKPKAKKLIINSRKTWLYLPQEKVVYTQESDSTFKSKILIKFLSGLGNLKDDFTINYAQPRQLDSQGNYLLVLTPRIKDPALHPFQITVDKTTSLILRVSFEDAMGNFTLLKFFNISTNNNPADKIFQFKPPEGVSVFQMQ